MKLPSAKHIILGLMHPGHLMAEGMTQRALEERGIHKEEEPYTEAPMNEILDKIEKSSNKVITFGSLVRLAVTDSTEFAAVMSERDPVPLDDMIGTPGFELQAHNPQDPIEAQ